MARSKDGIDQRGWSGRVAHFLIAEQIVLRRDPGLRRQLHDEVEIGGGEPLPPIRSDHRERV